MLFLLTKVSQNTKMLGAKEAPYTSVEYMNEISIFSDKKTSVEKGKEMCLGSHQL